MFLALLTSELSLVGRVHVHSVWVDDLALFLKVKGLFMALYFSVDEFTREVLLIIGEEVLWIWITDEPIGAPRGSPSLISGWVLLDYKGKKNEHSSNYTYRVSFPRSSR